MYDTYREHLMQQKHTAFTRWRESGYRSTKDWEDYIWYYEKLTNRR